MDEITRSIFLYGMPTAIKNLERLSSEDRDVLLPRFKADIPQEIIDQGYRELTRNLRKVVAGYFDTRTPERVILLGINLEIFDNLAREEFPGDVEVFLPQHFPSTDLASARRNVPKNLNLTIHEPGHLPTNLKRTDAVFCFGFIAAQGFALVDRNIEPLLGFLSGCKFRGDLCLLAPNKSDHYISSRPLTMNTVRLSAFRAVYASTKTMGTDHVYA